jgi:hypothetical protein
MFDYGKVVSRRSSRPGRSRPRRQRANTKNLPAFAWTYVPDANGADGGYYPDNVDPYSKVRDVRRRSGGD